MINGLSGDALSALESMQTSVDSLASSAGTGCNCFGTLKSVLGGAAGEMASLAESAVSLALQKSGELMQALSSNFGKITDLVTQANNITPPLDLSVISQFNSIISNISSQIPSLVGPLGSQIASIQGPLQDLLPLLQNVVGVVTTTSCSQVSSVLSNLGPGISPNLDVLTNSLDQGPFAAARAKFEETAVGQLDSIKSISQGAVSSFESLKTSIEPSLQNAVSQLEGLLP